MPDMLLNCFNYLYVNIYSSTIIYNLQIKCIVFMRGSDQRLCRLSSQRPSCQFCLPNRTEAVFVLMELPKWIDADGLVEYHHCLKRLP